MYKYCQAYENIIIQKKKHRTNEYTSIHIELVNWGDVLNFQQEISDDKNGFASNLFDRSEIVSVSDAQQPFSLCASDFNEHPPQNH